jgi:Heparinase II/III N-terminus/Heparinase II/III-like protein
MIVTRRTYAGRAIGFARKQVAGIGQRVSDRIGPSYLAPMFAEKSLLSYFKSVPGQLPPRGRERLAGLTSNYLAHRFDLLGSGWMQVRHGMRCGGVEGYHYDGGDAVTADGDGRWLEGRINRANLEESRQIWRLVERGYAPLDWQLDFKSGYRWSEATWYLDIRYGHKPGVDIKVPWELARMQHLPALACAHILAASGAQGFGPPEGYAREFRNQVLDFIATNPPRFGVNWRSAMEVAIRAANWVVAADLFRAGGASLDGRFERVLLRSLYEHGLHIESNLEWDPQVRGNHYLANVAGLLFISAYLPRLAKTDAWLAFAVRELTAETEYQFAADGSNREASTSYHRLSAEMVAYATALVMGLPPDKREALDRYDHRLMTSGPKLPPAPVPLYGSEVRGPFPEWYFERLEKMGEFVAQITKPNRQVPQIGDNDSGHFLRIDSVEHRLTVAKAKARYDNLRDYDALPDESLYWDVNGLDHRGLIAAIGALFNRHDLLAFAGEGSLEAEIIRGLTGGACPVSYRQRPAVSAVETAGVGSDDRWRALNAEIGAQSSTRSYEIPAPGGDLREGLIRYGYPDFGLYIFRSKTMYLAVRCGSFGLVGNGGHAHHDQLSIELSLDGRDLIVDPGTYLYSALRARRNEYRGALAHFAPQVEGRDVQGTGPGLFQMRDQARAQCLYFGPQGFAGCHSAYQVPVYRLIAIGADQIRITDCVKGGKLRALSPDFGYRAGWRESPRPSPAYGVVLRDRESTAR